MVVYEYGSVPLKEAITFKNWGWYVTSSGDLMEWDGEVQEFRLLTDSPLDLSQEGNNMENLTEVQLNLFWKLCK